MKTRYGGCSISYSNNLSIYLSQAPVRNSIGTCTNIASIPGRSQLRKTAWYTLLAHASFAPRILGIEYLSKLVSIIIVNDVIAQIIAVLIKQHNIYRGLDQRLVFVVMASTSLLLYIAHALSSVEKSGCGRYCGSLESTPIKNTYFNRPGIEANTVVEPFSVSTDRLSATGKSTCFQTLV